MYACAHLHLCRRCRTGFGRFHLLQCARGQGVVEGRLEHDDRMLYRDIGGEAVCVRVHTHMRAGLVLHTRAIGRVQEGAACVAHLDHVRSGVLLQHQLYFVTVPRYTFDSIHLHMITTVIITTVSPIAKYNCD